MQHKKVISWLLVVAVLCSMVLSVFYLAEEREHDCTGDDCPICVQIERCEQILRKTGEGAANEIGHIVIFIVCALFAVKTVRLFVASTPVSQKVRMDN